MTEGALGTVHKSRRIKLNDVSGDLLDEGKAGFIFTNVMNLGSHIIWTRYGLKQLAAQILAITDQMED